MIGIFCSIIRNKVVKLILRRKFLTLKNIGKWVSNHTNCQWFYRVIIPAREWVINPTRRCKPS